MSLVQTLTNVNSKNLDKKEAEKDIGAFSALEGEDGERIIEHLCVKYGVFNTARNKEEFEAGFDEGVRAVVIYLARMRTDYKSIKQGIDKPDV